MIYKINEMAEPSIVYFQLENNLFGVVWGEYVKNLDFDIFVINKDLKILLFSDEELKKTNFDVFGIYNVNNTVEIILKKSDFVFSKKISNEIVDLLNFFGDYGFQTNNEKIIKLYQSKIIQKYLDFNYDNYFWNKTKKPRVEFNKEQFFLTIFEIIETCKQIFEFSKKDELNKFF